MQTALWMTAVATVLCLELCSAHSTKAVINWECKQIQATSYFLWIAHVQAQLSEKPAQYKSTPIYPAAFYSSHHMLTKSNWSGEIMGEVRAASFPSLAVHSPAEKQARCTKHACNRAAAQPGTAQVLIMSLCENEQIAPRSCEGRATANCSLCLTYRIIEWLGL